MDGQEHLHALGPEAQADKGSLFESALGKRSENFTCLVSFNDIVSHCPMLLCVIVLSMQRNTSASPFSSGLIVHSDDLQCDRLAILFSILGLRFFPNFESSSPHFFEGEVDSFSVRPVFRIQF